MVPETLHTLYATTVSATLGWCLDGSVMVGVNVSRSEQVLGSRPALALNYHCVKPFISFAQNDACHTHILCEDDDDSERRFDPKVGPTSSPMQGMIPR